ncbi:MAG: hypothetical protein RLZZ08_65, partial [Pseudomonadota bacterium]
MTDPVTFASTSARFALPLLFSGQAQKEFYVNQAHAIIDALLHPVVEGTADAPPVNPVAGEAWLVGTAPSGAWAGHAGKLAAFQSGTWIFAAPRDGMRIFDRAAGQDARYENGWLKAARPAAPAGGATVDTQARTAITDR